MNVTNITPMPRSRRQYKRRPSNAEIIRDPYGRWWARDLGSRNGIRVNGHRVGEQLIAPNDVIQVSNFSLRLLRRQSAASTEAATRRPVTSEPSRSR